MPRRCSVRGCKSNYEGTGPYITMFRFPRDDELRARWLMAIDRPDYNPSPTSAAGVCIKHFDDDVIVRQDVLTRDDGTLLVAARKVPRLIKSAVPCVYVARRPVMGNVPIAPAPKRIAMNNHDSEPETKRIAIDMNALNNEPSRIAFDGMNAVKIEPEPNLVALDIQAPALLAQCILPSDNITSFDNFKESFSERADCSSWTVLNNPNYVLLMKLSPEDGGRVIVSLKVKQDISFEVYHEGVMIKHSKFRSLLGPHLLLDKWTKFESLIDALGTYEQNTLSLSDQLQHHINKIQKIIETQDNSDPQEKQEINSKRCDFALQQLQLCLSLKKSYNPDMLAWARTLYLCNSNSYNVLRDSDVLSLPHPVYLRKMIRGENTEAEGAMLKALLCSDKKPNSDQQPSFDEQPHSDKQSSSNIQAYSDEQAYSDKQSSSNIQPSFDEQAYSDKQSTQAYSDKQAYCEKQPSGGSADEVFYGGPGELARAPLMDCSSMQGAH